MAILFSCPLVTCSHPKLAAHLYQVKMLGTKALFLLLSPSFDPHNKYAIEEHTRIFASMSFSFMFCSWRHIGISEACMPAGVNYATWESAVHGFGSANTLRQLRRKRQAHRSSHKPAGPKLKPPQGGSFDARIGAYVVPFPGKPFPFVST